MTQIPSATNNTNNNEQQPSTNRHLHTQTSRYRHWSYPRGAGLAEKRQQVNQQSIERAIRAIQEERESRKSAPPETTFTYDIPADPVSPTDFVTADEQVAYCNIYESKIASYVKFFKFHESVLGTAITFFKRFYLENSVIDYDPKLVVLTAVFLAAKVENVHKPLSEFLAKVPKAPTSEALLEMEFTLAAGLKFQFNVPQVRWALHGLFLDMQTYLGTLNTSRSVLEASLKKLVETYAKAIELGKTSLYTDLTFTHWPSQVAMGCMLMAGEGTAFKDEVDRLLSSENTERLVDLQLCLDEVKEAIKRQIASEANKEAIKAEGSRIDAKLKSFRNPEFISDSALHTKRKREEQQEKEAKRMKKAKKENDAFADIESVVK
ncbi:hypothetical protein HDV05_003909 [Chytridiales sp. JEL 0842]|nr:hypothetical protein HDV05_003909 [Chytridiales sp. JEL 0842]